MQIEPATRMRIFRHFDGVCIQEPFNDPLTRPPGTLPPSEGERGGVRGAPAPSRLMGGKCAELLRCRREAKGGRGSIIFLHDERKPGGDGGCCLVFMVWNVSMIAKDHFHNSLFDGALNFGLILIPYFGFHQQFFRTARTS